jgi:hypothetical protein
MTQTDFYTLPEHLILMDYSDSSLAPMPEVFEDVAQARHYFNFMAKQSAHFACAFWAAHAAPCPSYPLARDALRVPIKPSLSYFDAAVPCTSAEFLAQGAKKCALVDQWMAAFRPLFEEKRAQRLGKACLAVSCLRSQFLIAYIGLRTIGTMCETSYDKYLDDFREMVDLCEELLFPVPERGSEDERNREANSDGHKEVFAFDIQSVMPLDWAAKKCRDPVVRRRAIRLLKARPRREGFWDSIVAAKVCEWVVSVEEEGMVGADVKDEARARGVGVGLELGRLDEVRSAKVWCTLGTGEKREGFVEW